ncbi:hypothetical protein Tco_0179912 [Tanacetum coccineum]
MCTLVCSLKTMVYTIYKPQKDVVAVAVVKVEEIEEQIGSQVRIRGRTNVIQYQMVILSSTVSEVYEGVAWAYERKGIMFLKGVALGSMLAMVDVGLLYSEIGTDVLRPICKVMVFVKGHANRLVTTAPEALQQSNSGYYCSLCQ